MKQTIFLGLLIASMILIACNTANTDKTGQEKNNNTEVTTPKTVPVTQNLAIPIRDFNGLEHLFHLDTDSVYVINFWATWCKPCVAELPYFEELGAKYQNERLKVILISLDFPNQIEKKLIPFIHKNELQSDVWVLDDADANTWIDKVSPQWSGAIPATLVYNRNAREFREQSFETYEELNAIVKPFFKN